MIVRATKLEEMKKTLGFHQTIIKHKLSDFIMLYGGGKDGSNRQLAIALKSHGFCFGFSLCDAAMEQAGKLAWWESALKKIADWDGSEEQLKNTFKLDGAEKSESLNSIINRVLNYIVYHYVASTQEGGIEIKNLSQPTLLDPDKNFFELQVKTESGWKSKKVIDRNCAAGNFSDEQLANLFNPEWISGNMCFLHSPNHLIRINYDSSKKQWLVYDPNYGVNNMHHVFNNVQDVIKEVKSIFHGQSTMAIDLIKLGFPKEEKNQMDVRFSQKYNAMIDSHPADLLKKNGMAVMLKYQRPALLKIIKKASDEKFQGRNDLISTLIESFKVTSKKKSLSNFYSMVRNAPDCFMELMKLADNEKNIKTKNALIAAIVQGLTDKNPQGKTALEILFKQKKQIPYPLAVWLAKSSCVLPKFDIKKPEKNPRTDTVDWVMRSLKTAKDIYFQKEKNKGFGVFSIAPVHAKDIESLMLMTNRLASLSSSESPQLFIELIKEIERAFDQTVTSWTDKSKKDFMVHLNEDPGYHYSRLLGTVLKSAYEQHLGTSQTPLPPDASRLNRHQLLSKLDVVYQFESPSHASVKLEKK